MTGITKRLSLAAAMILVSAAWAVAAEPPRTPEYRPYIAEVGAPRTLSRAQFEREVAVNSDLRSWVRNYGFPDVAEYQRVVPEYGWSDYEIRVFYFDYNMELAFGRVAFFPSMTSSALTADYGLVKYQGRIEPENLERVRHAPRVCGSGGSGSLERLLAAAERAERAAMIAEREGLRAAQSAQRAEAAVGRMDAGFRQRLSK